MATLKNTTINDTGFLKLPKGSTAQRPTNDEGRIRYNTDNNEVEFYTNRQSRGWAKMTIPFKTRQIITTAFMQGGYESSVAWNNVNKIQSSTDTTINLGDGSIERAHNYQWGANSNVDAYVFGAGGGHAIDSNYTIAFNMRTEQITTDIDRTLAFSRWRFGGVFQENNLTWFAGDGSSAVEKYNMTTKTALGTINQNYRTGSTWGMSTETYGLMYTTENAETFTFATETLSSRGGTAPSNHHQQKAINSKDQYAWAGNEGTYRGGNNFRRTNWATNTTSGTVPKPVTDSGEENLSLGQDHQYMLGMYNGNQNNISWKWIYATESGFRGASSMEPKGKPGASSGTMSHRD